MGTSAVCQSLQWTTSGFSRSSGSSSVTARQKKAKRSPSS